MNIVIVYIFHIYSDVASYYIAALYLLTSETDKNKIIRKYNNYLNKVKL